MFKLFEIHKDALLLINLTFIILIFQLVSVYANERGDYSFDLKSQNLFL